MHIMGCNYVLVALYRSYVIASLIFFFFINFTFIELTSSLWNKHLLFNMQICVLNLE